MTQLNSYFVRFDGGATIYTCYVIVIPWVVRPPVRGDNPRALASGISYVLMDKHGITILYHLHQCRPCISRGIPC